MLVTMSETCMSQAFLRRSVWRGKGVQVYTPEWTVSRMKASISESDCLAVPGWSSPLVYPASADCWAMSLVSLTPLLHSTCARPVLAAQGGFAGSGWWTDALHSLDHLGNTTLHAWNSIVELLTGPGCRKAACYDTGLLLLGFLR